MTNAEKHKKRRENMNKEQEIKKVREEMEIVY